MKFEGQIYISRPQGKDALMVDAEPHIMSRLRKIFDNAQQLYEQGKYTHKPIYFPITLSGCRDLLWLMERYNFEVADSVKETIQTNSEEYDRIVKSVSDADKDSVYKPSDKALPLALPLRDHQIKFLNMFRKMRRMLLADKMGLGKTAQAISVLTEPENRPAIVVVQAHLCSQWEREIQRFLPDCTTHVIRGFKNYPLPAVDVIITSYNRLAPWEDVLISQRHQFSTLILDEVQELRHTSTGKREIAAKLSERAKYVVGLSGTPIYNMGSEIFSVLDVIKPDCLGSYMDFSSEWCNWGKVHEPSTLHNFLKNQGLMLRRTSEEVGYLAAGASKNVITIDADLEKLKQVENVAKMLALSVLSGNVGEDSESARQFDYQLRHATGVAKARPVAEFVKMVLEEESKVVLVGWHRDVYDIWLKEFQNYRVSMFTGSESPKEKEKAVKSFIEGDSQIFIISLRSGAGLDGLQHVCNHIVFGELDWSPHVMDQLVARLDRDGQTKHTQAHYLTVADGSDPFMMSVIGAKRSQHDGLIDGKQAEAELIADVSGSRDRVREMAKSYLQSVGEEVPEVVPEIGLMGDAAKVLRTLKLPTSTEDEMQEAVMRTLEGAALSGTVERESRITKRSRLDFLIFNDQERVAVECKIESTKRAEVYRQVRRYVEEGNITSLILLAPWHGINSFKVDGVPVIVIDTTISNI